MAQPYDYGKRIAQHEQTIDEGFEFCSISPDMGE